MKIELAKKENIHFVGIGGIGMSGLALIMKGMGFKVQGSDISKNKNIDRLKKNKIKIFTGHSKKNIDRINKAFNTKYALLDTKSENYLVEHSSNVYIIDKDMIVQRIIANGLPSEEITKAIKKLID